MAMECYYCLMGVITQEHPLQPALCGGQEATGDVQDLYVPVSRPTQPRGATHHPQAHLSMAPYQPTTQAERPVRRLHRGRGVQLEGTDLLFLDWNRISSTEALREPDSSSFSTSLQRAHVRVMKHSSSPQHQPPRLTMSARSLPPSAWLVLALHP